MTIVTTTYRYKPPPKRKGRKLVRSPGRRPWPRKEAAAQGHCEAGRRRLKFESKVCRPWQRVGEGQADDNQAPPTLRASITSRPTMIASRRSCWPAASWRRCWPKSLGWSGRAGTAYRG